MKSRFLGVSVMIKGTDVGVSTDFDGNFDIAVENDDAVLVFEYLGMTTREIKAADASLPFVVVMEGHAEALDEVVAIGYGRVRKKDITGSVSSVKGDVVQNRNKTQLTQALQGTMAGVTVTRDNSEPGASGDIKIRGRTTIGDSDPLIIVDGVPASSIDDVNASDVEDISVLKDAASASVYGARAAAGVILITTKSGEMGKPRLQYNVSYDVSKPTELPGRVGYKRYMEMANELEWNDAGNPEGQEFSRYPESVVDNYLSLHSENPNRYPLQDWKRLMINNYATQAKHNITFSSGNENLKTRASLTYEDIGALYDGKKYERIMGRLNNDVRISDKLSAGINISYKHERDNGPSIKPIYSALSYPDVFAATWDDGRIGEGQSATNHYARYKYGGFDKTWRNKLNARISLKYEPIENLTFEAVVAPYLRNTKGKVFNKEIIYYDADDPTVVRGHINDAETTGLTETRSEKRDITTQFLTNYENSIGKHNFSLLAGYEGFSSFGESLTAKGDRFEIIDFPYLDNAPVDFMNNGGNAKEFAYESYFGRILYDFDNKYLLQANIRYDGSSRFASNYRWGSFPSVSAGWVLSEESFMSDIPALSFLKLFASWGQLGNERIGTYPYQSTIAQNSTLFYKGEEVVSSTSAALQKYAIENITWETTETVNLGLNIAFFKNRLNLNGEYYQKKTRDMLLSLELPKYMGYSNPDQNTGKMTTKGWDLELGWRDNIGDFNYSVSANISDAISRMGYLGGTSFEGETITEEGTQFEEWYGYKSDGLFQSSEEVANSPVLNSSVGPGDIKFLDVSGPDGEPDGKINPDYDRVPLGSSHPRFLYGGHLSASYRGFDLNVSFQGVGKQKSRLTPRMVRPLTTGWRNIPDFVDGNYWSLYNSPEQNNVARYPRVSRAAGDDNNYEMTDFWLIDGSYFRLKNVELGYTFNGSFTEVIGVSKLRLFFNATDFWSVNQFPKGWDPEVKDNDYMTMTFTLGANIQF